mmetsp:Transcript_16514/g.39755  ORF Transcript_16514/g.39755 Transcript_16514/m.39755 type:complete len:308 (-) Transcript_16514:659-1582(-)
MCPSQLPAPNRGCSAIITAVCLSRSTHRPLPTLPSTPRRPAASSTSAAVTGRPPAPWGGSRAARRRAMPAGCAARLTRASTQSPNPAAGACPGGGVFSVLEGIWRTPRRSSHAPSPASTRQLRSLCDIWRMGLSSSMGRQEKDTNWRPSMEHLRQCTMVESTSSLTCSAGRSSSPVSLATTIAHSARITLSASPIKPPAASGSMKGWSRAKISGRWSSGLTSTWWLRLSMHPMALTSARLSRGLDPSSGGVMRSTVRASRSPGTEAILSASCAELAAQLLRALAAACLSTQSPSCKHASSQRARCVA